MRQIAVISGKGGTGKTTVVAAMGLISRQAVLVDCDVDAANLPLLLPGVDGLATPFYAGQRAVVAAEDCLGCDCCAALCRFGAVTLEEGEAVVDPLSCEGCGACELGCPAGAITMKPNQAGVWMVRETAVGPLVHARLGVAQDNSGKLVAQVRDEARKLARHRRQELILIDGPPGIGCPVHAAVTATDLLLAVTEPSTSGLHDLERILELARTFKLEVVVLINKEDICPAASAEIRKLCLKRGTELVGQLPFDERVPQLQAMKKVPLDLPHWAEGMHKVWQRIEAKVMGG